MKIFFSPDTVKNSTFNPYKDISVWEIEIIKGNEPDNCRKNPTETEDFYFEMNDSNVIE